MTLATYEIKKDDRGQEYIKCKACLMRSYHPMDISQKYCPACKTFHSQPPLTETTPEDTNDNS